MATNNDYFEKLKLFGIDPDNLLEVTSEDILDIPRQSVEQFVARQSEDVRKLESYGFIRLYGSSIMNHSLALDAAGSILAFLQKTVTNFGAALKGNKTIRGALPSSISQQTKLLLTASPLPGSIVFALSPKVSGYDELYSQPALFSNENSPLADEAVVGILELLAQIDTSSPGASDEFISELDELGPRFTQSLGELLGELSFHHMDTEVVWNEPGHKVRRIDLSGESAGYARKLITEFKLDIEEMEIAGVLRTVSEIKRLDVQMDDGELISIERGEITDSVFSRFHTGQRVRLNVELSSGTKTGGKPVRVYKAISIKADDEPNDMESLF
jgi:hypothetical protein